MAACGVEAARSQWLRGEWDALVLRSDDGADGAERAELALLVASAHQHLGDFTQARRFARKALQWGLSKRALARVMIADVHNRLARAHALKPNARQMEWHFQQAVACLVRGGEAGLAGYSRELRELTRLGLFPQAVEGLSRQVRSLRDEGQRSTVRDARIRILESEVELLKHEFSIAQQRWQFYGRPNEQGAGSADARRELLYRKSTSQLGQDLWVLEKTNYKRNGFFVEFGATDGVVLSNSYLLESEFGWRGICAEPNPMLYDRLTKNRRCVVSRACIGGSTGEEVEFIMADVYGGIVRNAFDDHLAANREAYRTAGRSLLLKTVSLNDFLLRHHAPRDIDYLSIDTEGSEYEILRSFPFDRWRIRLITVEHNFTAQRALIRELLAANGYSVSEREWDDWYEWLGPPRKPDVDPT